MRTERENQQILMQFFRLFKQENIDQTLNLWVCSMILRYMTFFNVVNPRGVIIDFENTDTTFTFTFDDDSLGQNPYKQGAGITEWRQCIEDERYAIFAIIAFEVSKLEGSFILEGSKLTVSFDFKERNAEYLRTMYHDFFTTYCKDLGLPLSDLGSNFVCFSSESVIKKTHHFLPASLEQSIFKEVYNALVKESSPPVQKKLGHKNDLGNDKCRLFTPPFARRPLPEAYKELRLRVMPSLTPFI